MVNLPTLSDGQPGSDPEYVARVKVNDLVMELKEGTTEEVFFAGLEGMTPGFDRAALIDCLRQCGWKNNSLNPQWSTIWKEIKRVQSLDISNYAADQTESATGPEQQQQPIQQQPTQQQNTQQEEQDDQNSLEMSNLQKEINDLEKSVHEQTMNQSMNSTAFFDANDQSFANQSIRVKQNVAFSNNNAVRNYEIPENNSLRPYAYKSNAPRNAGVQQQEFVKPRPRSQTCPNLSQQQAMQEEQRKALLARKQELLRKQEGLKVDQMLRQNHQNAANPQYYGMNQQGQNPNNFSPFQGTPNQFDSFQRSFAPGNPYQNQFFHHNGGNQFDAGQQLTHNLVDQGLINVSKLSERTFLARHKWSNQLSWVGVAGTPKTVDELEDWIVARAILRWVSLSPDLDQKTVNHKNCLLYAMSKMTFPSTAKSKDVRAATMSTTFKYLVHMIDFAFEGSNPGINNWNIDQLAFESNLVRPQIQGPASAGRYSFQGQTKKAANFCFAYNRREGCKNQNCNFEHICRLCFQKQGKSLSHPQWNCRNRQTPDTNQNNQQE